MKNKANQSLRGKDGFEKYYSSLFGERWKDLKSALISENVYFQFQVEQKKPYFLDPASVIAAMALPLEGKTKILDMCAAPGGKTLVIASRMQNGATLTSNERSSERKKRLLQVCTESLSEEIFSRVKITCGDASILCKKQIECYDAILLDAPCSSERHVLKDEKYLSQWSPSRIKSLCMEQWSLLSCAFRLLQDGGNLVYSTCALNNQENDGIIERLLKKFDNAEIIKSEKPACTFQQKIILEPTKYGFHILPDKSDGAGPIYFCVIKKS